MTQKLNVIVRGPNGADTIVQKLVKRAYTDNGTTLYEHMDGTWGYKNAAPARSVEEIQSVVPAGPHRVRAMAWWHRVGQRRAQAYYADLAAQEAARIGDFTAERSDSELDGALYLRIPAAGGSADGPFAWTELFAQRPDWWGQFRQLKAADYTYTRVDDALLDAPPAADPPPTTAGLTAATQPPPGDDAEEAERKRLIRLLKDKYDITLHANTGIGKVRAALAEEEAGQEAGSGTPAETPAEPEAKEF